MYNGAYFEHRKCYIKKTVKGHTEFLFENYYKWLGFTEEDSYYSLKKKMKQDLVLFTAILIEKTSDFVKAKEHYDLFSKRKVKKVANY